MFVHLTRLDFAYSHIDSGLDCSARVVDVWLLTYLPIRVHYAIGLSLGRIRYHLQARFERYIYRTLLSPAFPMDDSEQASELDIFAFIDTSGSDSVASPDGTTTYGKARSGVYDVHSIIHGPRQACTLVLQLRPPAAAPQHHSPYRMNSTRTTQLAMAPQTWCS